MKDNSEKQFLAEIRNRRQVMALIGAVTFFAGWELNNFWHRADYSQEVHPEP